MRNANRPDTRLSLIWLLSGFLFLLLSNGRWALPAAGFLAPVCLVRFLALNKPLKGFLLLVFAGYLANLFIWKDFIPAPGFIYYIMTLMMSLSVAVIYLINRIYTQRIRGMLSTFVLPAAFVVLDYISVMGNPGGTFGALATAQTCLPLLQLVSVTGIWGITFIIFWTASVVNWLMDQNFHPAALRKSLLVFAVPVLLIILGGQAWLAKKDAAPAVRIASVNIAQQDIPHIFNDQPDTVNKKINEDFLKYCEIAALSEAKMVFGNEMMLNMHSADEEDYIEKVKTAAAKNNIYIGLPLLIYPEEPPGARPMNKMTWISPEKEVLFSYFKEKPTPGEGSYGGGIIKYFDSPYGRVSSVICFDMNFPQLIRQAGARDIDIMLVPGNDWKTITPYHTHAASFRALEQGFNLVRSVSRGLSAAYDTKGRLLSAQNYFHSGHALFYSDVPVKGCRTIYTVIGDGFAWACVLGFLSFSAVFLFRGKKGVFQNRQSGVE